VTTICSASTYDTVPSPRRARHRRCRSRAALIRYRQRCVGDEQRYAGAACSSHQRAVRVVVLEDGIIAVATDQICSGDVDQVDLLRRTVTY